MYLVNNEETLNYFHRFAKVNINGQPWDVQAVDSISTPNILQVALKESFSKLHEDDINKGVENSIDVDLVDESNEEPHIYGASTVYPYDTKIYEVRNFSGSGVWKIANASKTNIAKLIVLDENKVEVQILTGRSGEFELVFDSGDESLSLPISIETL
jgi:hypothetical protein